MSHIKDIYVHVALIIGKNIRNCNTMCNEEGYKHVTCKRHICTCSINHRKKNIRNCNTMM